MRLFAVGLSHRTAPVELRECVDSPAEGSNRRWPRSPRAASAAKLVVLSTCNRAEIYAVGDTDETADGRWAVLQRLPRHPACADRAEHLYVHRGAEAARHLFRVAAGLDSLVVGEPQILGQVKAAYATASDGQFTGRADEPAVPLGVRRRQARARRDRPRRRGGVGQLRGDRAGEEDLRRPDGPQRADLGAGEMAKLTGVHLQSQQRQADHDREPHAATAQSLAARLGGRRGPVGRRSTRRSPPPTSSSPPPARPSRC